VLGTPGFPAGRYLLNIEVSDAEAMTASADLTLDLEAASGLRVTSLELKVGDAGQPYADTLEAEGGAPPYTFIWPGVPGLEDLALEAETGAVSGTPRMPTGPNGEPVETVITVQDVVGASAFARVAFRIRPGPLLIRDDLPDGEVGVHYLHYPLTATGASATELIWTIASGALPPGLHLGVSNLRGPFVDGEPTTAGTYTFTLHVSASGLEGAREITVVITDRPLLIVTSTLPDADVGTPYRVFLVREGGTGPYQWDVVSGSLPAGIALSVEGELSGTPANAGDAAFEVRVRDALGQSVTGSLGLHVEP
jgi:hypothetical protein